jgi:hypothetical protein
MRALNPNNPEDAIWVSCIECDVLPGDPCKLDPSLANMPGFDKAVHFARIAFLQSLTELENA